MKRLQTPSGSKLSQTQSEAQKAFKTPAAQLTGAQLEKQALEENRQRLRALRLARDAASKAT
jgi:hypothetical protein